MKAAKDKSEKALAPKESVTKKKVSKGRRIRSLKENAP